MTKFVYNNAKHAFINMLFFETNMNYNSRKCYEKKSNSKQKTFVALNYAHELRRVNDVLRETMKSTQKTQTRYKNKRIKKMIYNVNDMI